jgi:predicted dehydrogenase
MADTIRWGILGTGNIARQFAEGLKSARGAVLQAVGSRTQKSADGFGARFSVPNRHSSYESLAADPEVDVVYIATPHPMHKGNSILCLESGKGVLCEKPFTINRHEAEEVVACARKHNLFLMEAMWTRFLPTVTKVRAWLKEGIIGEVRMVRSDFGFRADYKEESRLFAPEMAGGGLLDVGIYPISLAAMVLGVVPEKVTSFAVLGPTGVDDQNMVAMQYSNGAIAMTASAVRTNTPQDACIMGEEGSITLHGPFWRGDRVTLAIGEQNPETFHLPFAGNGYNYQAEAVMECIRTGKMECPIMSLDDTIAIMGILDLARAQWELRYPME